MLTMRAKAGAEAETLQREPTTTTRRRPSPVELPRRRLQGGSDATGAVVVRPKRSRLSLGKLTGEEGRGGKDDAFKKVNGARRRRRHWSARRPGLSPPPQSLPRAEGRRNAATTQESLPCQTRGSGTAHKRRMF